MSCLVQYSFRYCKNRLPSSEGSRFGFNLDESRFSTFGSHVYNARCTIRCIKHLSQPYSVCPCFSMESPPLKKSIRSPAVELTPHLPFGYIIPQKLIIRITTIRSICHHSRVDDVHGLMPVDAYEFMHKLLNGYR